MTWAKVREYATRFDAELARALLESSHIPCTIKAHEAGIFGAGFQGVVPSGVELYVPSVQLQKARKLLDDNELSSSPDDMQ